ncbi:hypothetical protein [Oceanospirillum sediminis]|uniref:Twin-arginine translocation pathway signal protein n=1 Tax=Oceanospirillum sediminis TaxID=2760088 RepID=A0A839IRW3_9GAMM|nr:hypothetical protein [Oceanospirillum sediminis]MBB1487410.1 hypothetical protein [Oceanospirillum sediminis]
MSDIHQRPDRSTPATSSGMETRPVADHEDALFDDLYSPDSRRGSGITRRGVLKTAIAFTLAGMTGGIALSVSRCSRQEVLQGFLVLRPGDASVLIAVSPAITGDDLPEVLSPSELMADPDKKDVLLWLQLLDQKLFQLGTDMTKEYLQLFDLLQWLPTRRVLTGQWSVWQDADKEQVSLFLDQWQASPVELLNKAHRAFTALIQSTWYSLDNVAISTGYPGPPLWALAAIAPVSDKENQ